MFFQDEEILEKYETDPSYPKTFGKYLGTYTHDETQVTVDICDDPKWGVTVHVRVPKGLGEEDIPGSWWKPVNDIVRQFGYKRVFSVNYGPRYYPSWED